MGDWALTLKRLWSLFEVPLKKADLFSIGKTQWARCVPLREPPPQHSELGYRTQRTGFWFHLTKNGNSFSYVKFQRCVNKAALWSHVVLFLWCHIFLLVQGGSCLFFLFYYLTLTYMPLEKAMATHSSTLAWKIPWMEEPGRLQSMGLLRVGHDSATSLSIFTFMHWKRKWQPTPVFLPRESQGCGSLVGCRLWGCTELDMTEVT